VGVSGELRSSAQRYGSDSGEGGKSAVEAEEGVSGLSKKPSSAELE